MTETSRIDPALLDDEPVLEAAMRAGRFELEIEPGVWHADGELRVPIDLIVPEGVAPAGGRRGARLGGHGNRAAHRAVGLEAALFDASHMNIASLDSGDPREVHARVAGPAALLVAKAHKLHDRLESPRPDRARDKDASDVFRLMQSTMADDVARTLVRLREHSIAGAPTTVGVVYLMRQFGRRNGDGIAMAARALRAAVPEARVRAVCVAYMERLAAAIDAH